MVTHTIATTSEFRQAANQGLIAHLMVVTHFVQKNTMDKLVASGRYRKLSLAYEGYFSLLAERDYAPGEIAARLGISKQACSKTVRELEQLGLIARRINPEDSRSSLLSLTKKGRRLLQDGIEAVNQIDRQFADHLGAARLQQIVRILEILSRSLGIDRPPYRALASADNATAGSRPQRLNVLIPKLSDYCHQTLLTSLSDKGFKDLSSSLGQVLGAISREGRRIQYIASILGISKQAVAASANELEQRGYLRRETDPDDKRQTVLHLSPKGKQLLAESVASVRALEKTLQNLITRAEYQQLEEAMTTLYLQIAAHYDTASVLRSRIQQLSESLLAELGVTGAHALAQQLMSITRGKL